LNYDAIIIGAGIVGAAAARELMIRRPQWRVLLLEKEAVPAYHQTGHNSGVVHAGVYYEPGSLKARFCREGLKATSDFCRRHGLPYRRTGKLLVAADHKEIGRMQSLLDRCRQNGLNPEPLTAHELTQIEPRIRGEGGFLVPDTAITDYPRVCAAMIDEASGRGAEILYGEEVTGIGESADHVTVRTRNGRFRASRLLVCGGLSADRLARMHGLNTTFRIIPYRGEYYRLHARLNGLIQHLVYPIPDPALPFLGVHLTLMTDGSITAGPNAVQGWKREGYDRLNFSLRDTVDMLSFPGFWKVTGRHFATGLREYRDSVWKRGYLARVRRYCPEIRLEDLQPHPAGIRAQAVRADGTMEHDFLLETTPRAIHVFNAPSPAATSSIPIARHLCDRLLERV
jgi:L-2-hydroxyglutarate oxidase